MTLQVCTGKNFKRFRELSDIRLLITRERCVCRKNGLHFCMGSPIYKVDTCLKFLNKQELAHKLRIENGKYWSANTGGQELRPAARPAPANRGTCSVGESVRRISTRKEGSKTNLTSKISSLCLVTVHSYKNRCIRTLF